ncbi:dnaJ homolog subfamily C member 4-like [Diadema antillarum]|uniref:dnaJ homolog subfamily C member 4-like n=1 Tax=Diadema antillarum TaxID=105358 RepID=UPI003A85DDBA
MVLARAVFLCSRCRNQLLTQSTNQGLLHHRRGNATSAKVAGQSTPTHYEVLGVKNDASAGEIKSAYFNLSKTLHPDANPNNPDQHDLFVQLNEAYGILSKPSARKEYDLSLTRPHVTEIRVNSYDTSPDNPYGGTRHTESYPKTHIFREGGDEEVHENYYGIRGVRRVNNTYIVYGCMVFIVSGAIFHFFVIKQSSQYATQRLDAKDQKIAELYNQAKERARINGPKKQMELLRERHNEFRMKLKNMGNDV